MDAKARGAPEGRSLSGVRFGVFDILQVDPGAPTGATLQARLERARRADALGLDYIFFAERHFMPLYRAATPALLLAALAGTTSQARLGVLAWTLALHNPVLLAEQISTLDHLTGGRLEVGVGLGHRPQEIAALGIPAEHRRAIFLEALSVMRTAWRGEPFSHDGAMFHLRDVLVDPPAQRPHPPLWFAGNDPTIATWAGRTGLNLALGFQPDSALQAPATAFAAARGEGSGARLAVMRNVYIAADDATAREEMVGDLVRVSEQLRANPALTTEPVGNVLTADEADGQRARLLEQQTVVAGGPATVAREIAATLRALNADVFLANLHLAGVDDARLAANLERYVHDVVPRVRAE